jgi:hypothetical protein
MTTKNDIIDRLVLQKNSLIENLSQDEIKDVDIYFEELLTELSPSLDFFNKLSSDEKLMKNITDAFKQEIKEQKWLEKLSKTFYDQEDIQQLVEKKI